MIATPIGNLEDISQRALRKLGEVDLLLCEDTRVTRKILNRFGIEQKTRSYREQNHHAMIGSVLYWLDAGNDLGLVSDAGTPGISDPGTRLVRDLLAEKPDLEVIPVPGPSAVSAALSVAGFPSDSYTFLGFPPHKKGRNAFIRAALDYSHPVVLYESPHRIIKTLTAISELDSERQVSLQRELTKLHESKYRGTVTQAMKYLGDNPKGEFVLILDRKKK